MKDLFKHLPKHKKDDLRRLTETIRGACNDVEMIILYGSYARGDYKEEKDLAPDRKSGAASDYDILVVRTCFEIKILGNFIKPRPVVTPAEAVFS